MITKKIISYKSYQDNGYEVRVYDDKSIIVVCPPYGFEWKLEDLPEHRSREIEPIIEFIQKDLNHSFNQVIE